ncbi:sugar ABC transporter ATP-binding protein [Blautia schinkii]|nr:sugar ABC transporter ATP-binding protein [Blautia schinkii]
MSDFILEMKHIYKSYGGIHALSDVGLDLKAGEVLCLCGENGAGKSTLMKILAGVETPTEGEIYINGRPVRITKPIDAFNEGISMVHQELVQIEEMTVAENIYVGRFKTKAGFVDKKALRENTLKLFEELDIFFEPDSLVRQYSVANRQLIEIAKALSHNCSIIIFDEPTAALTIEETEKLYRIIRRLKQKGMAVILISHRMEDIYAVGDRVEVLKDGENSGTLRVSESKVDDIVKLMIGRTMTQQFPHKTNQVGDVIMEVKNLTNSKISNISFDLRRGEVLGVAGLVGAGRTELLRAIFGLDACEGNLTLNGKRIVNQSPMDGLKRGFALVPEDRKDQGLILNQSILQNIVLSILKKMSAWGIMKPKKETVVCEEYIQKLKIRASGKNMIVQMLSGGNQQKVVLGKCLASKPEILLLDEPTRGVDVGAKAEIYKIINDLACEGISIIVVSSEMTELLGISDRILVMHEGYLSGELSMNEASEEAIMRLAISHEAVG